MTANAIPKSEKTSAPIYVIEGKERDLVSLQTDELLDEIIEPDQRAVSLLNADPDKTSITDVLDELRTLPFLADIRVFLLKDADKFISQYRDQLEKYFDNPSPTATLILTVNSWPGNTKLAKKLTGAGKLISVASPKPWQLPARLIQYTADAHDKTLTKPAAELLVELTSDQLARLYTEIDKLATFAADKRSITAEHVESLIGHNRIFNAFAVIDAMTAGNTAQAIDRLRKMFAEDKTTEYTAVGAFAFHFRRLFNAKALLEKGKNPAQIASELRIWGKKDAFFAQVKRMSLKQIGDSISQLAQIDYQIKTGQAMPQTAIEKFIFTLAKN